MIQIEKGVLEILEKPFLGKRISKEEAFELILSKALFPIGEAADNLREKKCGNTVSYVVNRNINFTNICIGSCKFCAYRVSKDSSNGFVMTPNHVLNKVQEAVKAGATEVCLQGGLNPDLGLDYYLSILETIKAGFDIHIHAFSPMEVYFMADKSGLGIRETLLTLKEKGLDSIPGTAAEIFDREVREILCPNKIDAEEWIHIIKTAHGIGIPTTATMLYGHIERPEHRINHLNTLRKIQDETKGFTEFVPLSFIHYNTPLRRLNQGLNGASGLDDLMVYSVSRLFLDNFENIQSSWVKLGKKLAQVALFHGANDMGGTLMDETISRSAGQKIEVVEEKEMRSLIESAGRVPKKRDTLYNLIE